MIVRSPAGAPVLTLGDTGVVGGYMVTEYQQGQRGWNTTYSVAARVDDEFQLTRSAAKVTHTVRVYIEGASLAEVQSRYVALLAAVEMDLWILDVMGDGATALWVCDAATSEPTFYPDGSREVSLTIPASPGYGY